MKTLFTIFCLTILTWGAYGQVCGSTSNTATFATHCDLTVGRIANINPSTSASVNQIFRDAFITSFTTTGSGAATYNSATGTLNIPTPVTTVPGSDRATAYSSGTAYTLTTSSAKVDFGTTDPQVTIPAAGTYLIYTNLKIEYAGLTTALNNCSFKLRRTNNTASDLTNATTTFNVPALTLATGTGGDVDIPVIIYTTANNNDVIELWGNRSGGLTLGSLNVGEASVVAVRIQ